MCVPAAVDAAKGSPDWQVFAMSAAVTFFFGVAMTLFSRSGMQRERTVYPQFLARLTATIP